MKTKWNFLLPVLVLFLLVGHAHAAAVDVSKWLRLDTGSKERISQLIKSDVERRKGFSTAEEDRINTSMVEDEKQKENSAYKAAINAANSEFRRTKKRADDLTAQFQTSSYDFEETKKNVDNIKAGIDNIDNLLARYQQDVHAQRQALAKWLKTTKQGEAVAAVIYTRGFMDSAHRLERLADEASAPLMAKQMGDYIQSFTKVVNSVMIGDFIQEVEEGTAKWNSVDPLLIPLLQSSRGTTYLRIKCYELYPFQAPDTGNIKPGSAARNIKAQIILSMKDLDSFLVRNGYSADKYDLSAVKGIIKDAASANQQAKANQREQLISFNERISYLKQKTANSRSDKKSMVAILNLKESQLKKMASELEVLKLKKDSAELAFHNAEANLTEKQRVHESIIIKTSLVTVKRSETPAEAAAEVVMDELKDVLNDARIQHYTSTTDVVNGKLVGEAKRQEITNAKILAVRSLSFMNEGDSIRVKIAFRVRTILDATKKAAAAAPTPAPFAMRPLTASVVPPKAEKVKHHKPPRRLLRPAKYKRRVVRKLPAKRQPFIAVEGADKSTFTPTMKLQPLPAAKQALGFIFKLDKVSTAGTDLIFWVGATNKADHVQYLAFYDESSTYARSSITISSSTVKEVNQIYFRQGQKKTPAIDAYRGVPIQPDKSVTVEFIFKGAAPGTVTVSQLKLLPTVGRRVIFGIYRWRPGEDVVMKNISVP